jgi:hypothetical protein
MTLNKPFRQGLMIKGTYTYSQAKDMTTNGEDGWVGLTWNHPMVYDKNFAIAVFDRPHIFQMGFVYDLPFLKENTETVGKILGGWQVNGIFGAYSGTPYSIGGTNTAMNCAGCGTIYINVNGDPSPVGSAGSTTEPYYDKSVFSQPSGLDRAGWGNALRNQFRRPSVWNLDFGVFKAFQIGSVRPELRISIANIFDHVNWGAPNTTFTSNQFMLFSPSNSSPFDTSTNTPGARRVEIGVRVGF